MTDFKAYGTYVFVKREPIKQIGSVLLSRELVADRGIVRSVGHRVTSDIAIGDTVLFKKWQNRTVDGEELAVVAEADIWLVDKAATTDAPRPQHTKDFLAQELRAAGLEVMAARAEIGFYHDFLSPLLFPETELHNDLLKERNRYSADSAEWKKIEALRQRHINGEFDASKEESDEWMRGPEGQEAVSKLLGGE